MQKFLLAYFQNMKIFKQMKKIGILGSGDVGKTLGSGFIKHGYHVMIGTRDVTKLAKWKSEGGDMANTEAFPMQHNLETLLF